MIILASAISGGVLLALVWTTGPVTAAGLLILLGGGLGVLTPVAWGVFQEITPRHMLGRALAFYTMGAMGAALGGITFFGWVMERVGVSLTVAAIGMVMAGTALLAGFFWRGIPTEKGLNKQV